MAIMKASILALLGALCFCAGLSARPALVVVLVIDGLRPDSVTPEVMPHLYRLKSQGAWYTHAHSVFPTVTRVNTTSIVTGMLPARHGIVSNALYLPEHSPALLSNGDYRNLLLWGEARGGRVVGPKSLHEYLREAGISYVALSSGSTGNALLLNPTAAAGDGQLVNPGFEGGKRVAFPDSLNAELLRRFGPAKGGKEGDEALLWTERVLREYVLGTLRPQVIVNWMGRSDSAQHGFGVGSPEGLAALRLVDAQIGLLLARLRELELWEKTNLLVTSDHGFDYEPRADLLAPLREPEFEGKVAADREGGTTLLYVKNRDAGTIERLVEKFQALAMTNAVFVAGKRPVDGKVDCVEDAVKGFLPGTFALELAAQCIPKGGADLIVTHRWSADPNPFGVAGTQWVPGSAGQPAQHGHGGLNPYVTHSTLLAVGPDFAQGQEIEVPAGNTDITPTVLTLEGIAPPRNLDGRVLGEAFRKRTMRTVESATQRLRVSTEGFCAELELSHASGRRYLDLAKRCDAGR
ncbi:MAG: alkaline phosphatase family protein [Bryobacterales bacterium]|nr:alkaline phosphatase family protein [Bryobacterales bacterium]